MFEPVASKRSFSWPAVAGGLAIFVAVVGLVLFLLVPGRDAPPQLEGVLHRGDPDYDWYQKYVNLRDPKIQMGRNYAGSRIVMFSGVVENMGERELDVVEVELSFFNYDDLVWRTARTPIRPGHYTPPVESLEQRGFTLYIEDLPPDWIASHAEMTLHGFRFRERP